MTLGRGKDFMHNAEMGMGSCGLVLLVLAGTMGRILRKGPERLDVFPVREHEEGEVGILGGHDCEWGRST